MSEKLIGACIFGQSGGPTSVINASAYGVIRAALDAEEITNVYGAAHGIKGVLDDKLYVMEEEDPDELRLLLNTPSSELGSCRYKIADPDVDDTDYKRILEIFKKYNVRYFFYNGGNDSMDTCNKISKYMQKVGYECRVNGVPKTIDNDLFGTDHCPGFASAAKYIATSCMEINKDARVYDTGMVTIVEIMGRHAGWLAASAALATEFESIMPTAVLFQKQRRLLPTDSVMHSSAVSLRCWLKSSRTRWAARSAVWSSAFCSAAVHTSPPQRISGKPRLPVPRLLKLHWMASPTRWLPLSVLPMKTGITSAV